MKPIIDTLLGLVPEQHRKFVTVVFAVILILLWLAPHLFGASAEEIKSIALTQVAPTPTP